jgi:hypothetical protein
LRIFNGIESAPSSPINTFFSKNFSDYFSVRFLGFTNVNGIDEIALIEFKYVRKFPFYRFSPVKKEAP